MILYVASLFLMSAANAKKPASATTLVILLILLGFFCYAVMVALLHTEKPAQLRRTLAETLPPKTKPIQSPNPLKFEFNLK